MKNKRALSVMIVLLTVFLLNCRTADTVANWLATPTPTATRTPRPTFTSTATQTFVPPTVKPTSTTQLPKTLTRTRVPATRTPGLLQPVPTSTTNAPLYPFRVLRITCVHSGQSFVEGLVLENADLGSGINGKKVRMSAEPGGGAVDRDSVTEDHFLSDVNFPQGNYPGYFNHVVNAFGAAPGQIRYLWVVDGSGKALSDPAQGKAVFDAGAKDDSCWNVQIVFVKQ